MSSCPEPIRQLVRVHGFEQVMDHLKTHISEEKQRIDTANTSYEADEKDFHDQQRVDRQFEVIQEACDKLCGKP